MLELKDRIDETAHTAKGISDTCADGKAKETADGVMGAVKEKMHDVTDGAADMVGKATDKVQEWAHDVGDAAVHAKDKAKEWAHDVGDAAVHAKDKAKEWAHDVGDAAVHAKDKTQQMASATVDKVEDLGKDVTDLIRRYPIAALLVGVGAGFLLGQVLHASSKRA
jgi:ElaB/YqjD/DUF883 family membrane-anchored ribosome-binding protein